MKRRLIVICMAALILTGCGNSGNFTSYEMSEPISDGSTVSDPRFHEIVSESVSDPSESSSESYSEIGESVSENVSSSDISAPAEIEKPKIGDLMGAEDMPLRGKAFCISSDTSRDADGKVIAVEYLVYDEHDNIIAMIGEESYYYGYEYDENGNIIKEYSDWSNAFTEYEYKDGLVVKMHYTASDGLTFDEIYEYDEHGTQIKTTLYGESYDDTAITTVKPEYDAQGRLVRETDYGSDGNVYSVDEYEYNDKGEIIKETTASSFSGNKMTTEYVRDERGNVLSEHIKSVKGDGTVISESRIEYEYNSDNKQISERNFNIKDGTETLRYFWEHVYEY